MRKISNSSTLSRRDILKLGGGLITGTVLNLFTPNSPGRPGELPLLTDFQSLSSPNPDIHLAVCDGWIHLPQKIHPFEKMADPAVQSNQKNDNYTGMLIPDFNPNNPETGETRYIFGYRDVTCMSAAMAQNHQIMAQASAPFFWVDQGQVYSLALTNLGLQMSPKPVDSHTVYWHGFSNTCVRFGSEPQTSLSIQIGQTLTLLYKPHNPGAQMYRCRFKDHGDERMDITGTVFVRPIQNGNTAFYPSGKYAYNDGDGSTGFDREFVFILTEIWSDTHREFTSNLPSDRVDSKHSFSLLNGRGYPDTLIGNGGEDAGKLWGYDAITADLLPPQDRPDLRNQPHTSLVEVNSGERILLRFVNLSFHPHAMTIAGLKMKVVGRNATLLRGQDGTDLAYETKMIYPGRGESYDVIIQAPRVVAETKFLLFDRLRVDENNGNGDLMTEIRVHPANKMAPQTSPNTNPLL